MSSDLIEPPVGASVWESELFGMLTDHVAKERGLLEEYEEASHAAGSAAMTYLVDLLIEDERRHHRIFLDLASSLKIDAELGGQKPAVPNLDFNRMNADDVLDVTERLLDSERDDARELKRLHKVLTDVEDTTLWSLLIEMMQHDTDKHIALLRFASRHAKPFRTK